MQDEPETTRLTDRRDTSLDESRSFADYAAPLAPLVPIAVAVGKDLLIDGAKDAIKIGYDKLTSDDSPSDGIPADYVAKED